MVLTLTPTSEVVEAVAAALAASPAPAAGPRVVAIDGRSSSGKTDLAVAVGARLGALVVHMDDLYPGWGGLAPAVDLLAGLLADLRRGRETAAPVWDWAGDRWSDVRRRRALARDGETFAPHWDDWAVQEEALYARADLRPDVLRRTDAGPDGDVLFAQS